MSGSTAYADPALPQQILFATFFQVVLLGTPLEALSILGSVLILANGAWVASAKAADDDGIAVH